MIKRLNRKKKLDINVDKLVSKKKKTFPDNLTTFTSLLYKLYIG